MTKAFIGVNGISIKNGFTTANFLEAQLKKIIIQVAGKTIIVADRSKLNKVCFSIIGELKEASSIITSCGLEKEILYDVDTLKFATACGAATVRLEGTGACTFSQINELISKVEVIIMEEL